MNTIYDNTFTLGQTSATNFQAGPGISITQPSEGTVRIANDETVLWDGSSSPVAVTSGNSITLSELASNFERILVCCGSTDGSWSVYNEFPPFATRWEVVRWSEDGSSYVIRDGCLLTKDSTDGAKWNCIKGRRMQWNSNNTWSMTAYNTFYIYKVIGINRIGGNE